MTAAERKARFDALVAIGCCVCRREHGAYTPPQVHHLRGHPWSGAGQRADDRFTIPLCFSHHQGGEKGVAYHAGARSFEANYGTQAELLAYVDAQIASRAAAEAPQGANGANPGNSAREP